MNHHSQSYGTYRIVLEDSPIYECAMDIAAYTRPEVHDKLLRGPESWQCKQQQMGRQLADDVALAGRAHTWRSLLFLAHRCVSIRSASAAIHVESLVDEIDRLGPDIVATAAPYLGWAQEERLQEAVTGSEAARRQLLATYFENPVVHNHLAYLFEVSWQSQAQHLKHLLTGWYALVGDEWELLLDCLRRDREHKQLIAEKTGPSQLVKLATNGLELDPEPRVDTLWFVPQVAYRPLTIVNRVEGTLIYYYPVSDEHLPDTWRSEPRSLADLYKALGDVHRLQMLRALVHAPRTVTELSVQLSVAKSTAHHHLSLLRAAGLVVIEDGLYRWNEDAVRTVNDGLWKYLS